MRCVYANKMLSCIIPCHPLPNSMVGCRMASGLPQDYAAVHPILIAVLEHLKQRLKFLLILCGRSCVGLFKLLADNCGTVGASQRSIVPHVLCSVSFFCLPHQPLAVQNLHPSLHEQQTSGYLPKQWGA